MPDNLTVPRRVPSGVPGARSQGPVDPSGSSRHTCPLAPEPAVPGLPSVRPGSRAAVGQLAVTSAAN